MFLWSPWVQMGLLPWVTVNHRSQNGYLPTCLVWLTWLYFFNALLLTITKYRFLASLEKSESLATISKDQVMFAVLGTQPLGQLIPSFRFLPVPFGQGQDLACIAEPVAKLVRSSVLLVNSSSKLSTLLAQGYILQQQPLPTSLPHYLALKRSHLLSRVSTSLLQR